MDTAEIRRRFVAHFEARAATPPCRRRSLLLDDPNLLFVNAGMVPFKPYFLGQETPPYDRATSVQKCVRTPDIEDVGKTTRHGTFFEMCGNFSFGDYFKEGAIELAWDLVTKSVGRRRLRPRGEPALAVASCTATTRRSQLWMKVTGLPDERIVKLGPKENYWSMGVPGPGGPCSEILYDRGPEYGPDGEFATTDRSMPAKLEDRYLEIWNLVFMQDELSAVRSKEDFDIVGAAAEEEHRHRHGPRAGRVPAAGHGEHVRDRRDVPGHRAGRWSSPAGATAPTTRTTSGSGSSPTTSARSMMLIGDGVTPGNEGRGYVLRRLLRRAVRSMRLLGYEDRALPELLPVSRDKMGETYPELHRDWERISHGRVRRGGRVPPDAPGRHPDLRPRGRAR